MYVLVIDLATIGRNDFAHLGCRNWKMHTSFQSHSLFAGSEQGKDERDEYDSLLLRKCCADTNT